MKEDDPDRCWKQPLGCLLWMIVLFDALRWCV